MRAEKTSEPECERTIFSRLTSPSHPAGVSRLSRLLARTGLSERLRGGPGGVDRIEDACLDLERRGAGNPELVLRSYLWRPTPQVSRPRQSRLSQRSQ